MEAKTNSAFLSTLILDYLRKHGSITSMEAFNMGATRLSAIIFTLRRKGFDIETVYMDGTNRYGRATRYGRYFLRGEPAEKAAEAN